MREMRLQEKSRRTRGRSPSSGGGWGRVRSIPKVGWPCAHFLCPLLGPASLPWVPHNLCPGWLRAPPGTASLRSSPSALAHLQASPPPRGLTSAPARPRCLLLFSSLPTPDSNCSFILTSPKPTGTLLCSKTFHDLQLGLLRVSGLCPTQGHPGSVQSHLPCPWARLCLPIGRGASVYFSKRHCWISGGPRHRI